VLTGFWPWRGTTVPASAPAAPSTTWDAAASSTDYTLSGGNLTATRSTGIGDVLVKASVARTSGYFEVVPTVGGGSVAVGLTDTTQATNDWLGDGTHSIGYHSSGAVYDNGGSSVGGTWATYTSSDVIGVCLKAGKVYFSKNGTWQNSADPSAGTGGIDVSAFVGSALPGASTNNLNAFTARFTSGFTGTIPSGVSAWS
jgi:hypothetical protein